MPRPEIYETEPPKEKAILVGIEIRDQQSILSLENSLEELNLLAETAGVEVVGELTQKLDHPNPSTFIGSGKVSELKSLVAALQADMVIFDDELNPRNFRELEEALPPGTKVIDRTGLILDIFALHASTREGKLQVELAQYEYLYPRLTRAWTHLVRQAGGGGGRTGNGGVGLRGPGETQLEVDRRKIRNQISSLKKELEKVQSHRQLTRAKRKNSNLPLIALVGYTNAGKSTLVNALTKANVYVANKLFATLDPTTRQLWLSEGKEALITDTVGFIQKLPHQLVAAFHSTLEDITQADLLLHVVDISNPNAIAQWKSVLDTLIDIKADDIPILTILNKIDKFPNLDEVIHHEFPQFREAIPISAQEGVGLSNLLQRIREMLYEEMVSVSLKIPYNKMDLVNLIHQSGLVEKSEHEIDHTHIQGKIPTRLYRTLSPYIQE